MEFKLGVVERLGGLGCGRIIFRSAFDVLERVFFMKGNFLHFRTKT